ncbi:MAG: iron-sulfur cluster assembly accessory protein [Pseudomonadota bacterium]
MINSTINLTDSAAEHIKNVLAKNQNGVGLRLGVKPTGCSGYQYIIDTATDITDKDETIESKGIKVIIDKKSLDYFNGTTLDFCREGLNSGFKFQNPNVEDSCGCGESVSFKQTQ